VPFIGLFFYTTPECSFEHIFLTFVDALRPTEEHKGLDVPPYHYVRVRCLASLINELIFWFERKLL
jgi:hypothetical protein